MIVHHQLLPTSPLTAGWRSTGSVGPKLVAHRWNESAPLADRCISGALTLYETLTSVAVVVSVAAAAVVVSPVICPVVRARTWLVLRVPTSVVVR